VGGGYSGGNVVALFSGDIDELAVWDNFTLSASDAANLYSYQSQ
jgi:hypothetical protein